MAEVEIDAQTVALIERHRRFASESAADILKRILPLVPLTPAPLTPLRATLRPAPLAPLAAILPPAPPGTRRRGQWAVEIRGERIPAANLKSAYRTLLQALDARHPDFLELLAGEGSPSRRFVARSPRSLYGVSPHLARRHAEPLAAGWYFDTNISTVQVARRARVAARICGLRYGTDVRILENLREI